MESNTATITLTLAEWKRLDGLDQQFDEKLKSAVRERIDAERAFVLRDRDEYVRRNDRLDAENRRLHDSAAEMSGTNARLRFDLGKAEKRIADLEGALRIASTAVDVAKEEARKRNETENSLRVTINCLHEKRLSLIRERDALLRRGLFDRILNRR